MNGHSLQSRRAQPTSLTAVDALTCLWSQKQWQNAFLEQCCSLVYKVFLKYFFSVSFVLQNIFTGLYTIYNEFGSYKSLPWRHCFPFWIKCFWHGITQLIILVIIYLAPFVSHIFQIWLNPLWSLYWDAVEFLILEITFLRPLLCMSQPSQP